MGGLLGLWVVALNCEVLMVLCGMYVVLYGCLNCWVYYLVVMDCSDGYGCTCKLYSLVIVCFRFWLLVVIYGLCVLYMLNSFSCFKFHVFVDFTIRWFGVLMKDGFCCMVWVFVYVAWVNLRCFGVLCLF